MPLPLAMAQTSKARIADEPKLFCPPRRLPLRSATLDGLTNLKRHQDSAPRGFFSIALVPVERPARTISSNIFESVVYREPITTALP